MIMIMHRVSKIIAELVISSVAINGTCDDQSKKTDFSLLRNDDIADEKFGM